MLIPLARVAEVQFSSVQFSSVLPPLRENLKLDLNLRGHLVQNEFYKVWSMVQVGSDLKKRQVHTNVQVQL